MIQKSKVKFMESEVNAQKMCPACDETNKNLSTYCAKCGALLEEGGYNEIQTSSNLSQSSSKISFLDLLSGAEKGGILAFFIFIGISSTVCYLAGVSLNIMTILAILFLALVFGDFIRRAINWSNRTPAQTGTAPSTINETVSNSPTESENLLQQEQPSILQASSEVTSSKTTISKMSDATIGFLLIFALFMGVGTIIFFVNVKVPIQEALIASLILALIFGGFTSSMIRMPKKGSKRKAASGIFWFCFILFGMVISFIFSRAFLNLGVIICILAGFGIGLLIGLIGGAFGYIVD